MFEGLFSPWHLLILALVVFLVYGPRKMAARWHDVRDAGRRLIGDDDQQSSAAPGTPAKRSIAYRLGQKLRRR